MTLDVVGAVIVRDGRILAARRAHGELAGCWEFPGGKVEPGEAHAEALRREITEELACEVEVGDPVVTTLHPAERPTVALTTYRCRLVAGTPTPTEHDALRWLAVHELLDVAWAPADLPAVQVLRTIG